MRALKNGQPECLAALIDLLFGMSLWLALALHVLGVELYLGLTRNETEKLRGGGQEGNMESATEEGGRGGDGKAVR